MKILQINNNLKLLESYFLLAKNNGTIFNSQEWSNVFENEIDIYGIFNKSDNMIGGFQLRQTKKAGIIKFLSNPLYQPHNAMFFNLQSTNQAKKNSEIRSIIQAVCDFVKDKSNIISFAFPPDIFDMMPFYQNNYKIIPNYTYQINLKEKEEDIFSFFSPEKKNDIRRAEKDGLLCVQETDLNAVYDIIKQTFAVKSGGLYNENVKKILFEFANENNSSSFVTYFNDKPIAASFCIFTQNRAFYLLGGYSRDNKHGGAGALSIWNNIKFLKALGVNYFDFEGSMIPDVEKYFRSFGGQLTPYYTINKANLILEIALKFIKRQQF